MATSARARPRLALAGGSGGDGPRMTPELRRAIALLQLSRRELIEEIRRELAQHHEDDGDGEESRR